MRLKAFSDYAACERVWHHLRARTERALATNAEFHGKIHRQQHIARLACDQKHLMCSEMKHSNAMQAIIDAIAEWGRLMMDASSASVVLPMYGETN